MGRGDCKTSKIESVNDKIKERGCPWCNLEVVEAVMLMLVSTVIRLLGNILAIYVGCKAVIPCLFSGAVYPLLMMLRVNTVNMMHSNDPGNDELHLLKVNLCDGALVSSCYLKVCVVRTNNSAYVVDGSVIQCVGVEFLRRDVRATARMKIASDSGRRYEVKMCSRNGRYRFQRLPVSADKITEPCNN